MTRISPGSHPFSLPRFDRRQGFVLFTFARRARAAAWGGVAEGGGEQRLSTKVGRVSVNRAERCQGLPGVSTVYVRAERSGDGWRDLNVQQPRARLHHRVTRWPGYVRAKRRG
jgi:hypothetical protein